MKKIISLQVILLTIIGLCASCSTDDDATGSIIEMRVNHFQNTGFTLVPVLTMMVQEGEAIGTDCWTRFYNSIEGFEYVPGKIYELSVRVQEIKDPPLDGGDRHYTLLKINSTQDVDKETLFDIDLKSHGNSFVSTTSGYGLLERIKIDCAALCEELESKVNTEESIIGTFKRISSDEIQLVGLK